jgi:hypothetical protein
MFSNQEFSRRRLHDQKVQELARTYGTGPQKQHSVFAVAYDLCIVLNESCLEPARNVPRSIIPYVTIEPRQTSSKGLKRTTYALKSCFMASGKLGKGQL